MTTRGRHVWFGLGLVSLGRIWGFRPAPLPSAEEARRLLHLAVELGVTLFDTAPAYGSSEALAGEFFRNLAPDRRRRLTLATKCGEHWDETQRSTWVDHSEKVLRDSLARSFDLLGAIDVLQVHKTTADVLRRPGLWRVLDAARARGVAQIGASVSDLDAGRLACEIDAIDLIQMPYNARFRHLEPLFGLCMERGKLVWTNRPFAAGAMIHEDGARPADAYRSVLEQPFAGAILTGSVNPEHLREDWEAFEQALRRKPIPDDSTAFTT
jgi:aryl-alcohol dehydrogenase-like predicted oxidoreductase